MTWRLLAAAKARLFTDAGALLAVPAGCLALLIDAYYTTEVGDSQASICCRYPPASDLISQQHVRQLEEQGFIVLEGKDAVLKGAALRQAREDVKHVLEEGRFHLSTNDCDVRQDSICWIRGSDGTPCAPAPHKGHKVLGTGLLHCVQLLRGITYEIERHRYSVSTNHRVPQQLQLSCFPGDSNSTYMEHLDQCSEGLLDLGLLEWLRLSDYRKRSITAIIYLNSPCWGDPLREDRQQDGGQLRIFHDAHGTPSDGGGGAGPGVARGALPHTDVVPRGGTMVVFDSRRMRHQVLPSTRTRHALTVWVCGDSIGREAAR